MFRRRKEIVWYNVNTGEKKRRKMGGAGKMMGKIRMRGMRGRNDEKKRKEKGMVMRKEIWRSKEGAEEMEDYGLETE